MEEVLSEPHQTCTRTHPACQLPSCQEPTAFHTYAEQTDTQGLLYLYIVGAACTQ